jgi:amino acid transporter
MKRTVLVFGLIAGIIVTAIMVISMARCYSNPNFESSMVLGYASMLLAFSFIYVGVKNYRDKYNEGIISFGKAFKVGFLICLVASTVYVLVWLIDYYLFIPDFMDKYTAHTLLEAKKSGASATELASKTEEMNKYKEMYKNPIWIILLTYMEIIPIGLVVSLISAMILKRKSNDNLKTQMA